MARFQYNKFLENSGKPKKPPLLSKRMEDNRISFRIDEEEQINDTLWQYGDGDYGTAGFKMKSGRFAKGTRIAATWSDKQFTSWVESFHLKPLREEFVFSVDGSTIEADFDLDLVLPNWVMVYYYDEYSWNPPNYPSSPYPGLRFPGFDNSPNPDIPEFPDIPDTPNFDPNNPNFDPNNPNFDPEFPEFDPNFPDFNPTPPNFDPETPNPNPNFPELDPNFPRFPDADPNFPNPNPDFPEFDPNFPPDIPVNPPGNDPDGPPDTEGNPPVDEPPDATDVVSEIPEGTDVPLLAITLSPKATRHNTPEVPLVFTVSMLNFNGTTEPVDYDMLVPLRVMGSGAAGADYELSGIIPSSAFGDGPASRFDVGAFALIPKGQTSVDVTVTPLNPANQDTVDITLEVMPLFAFTKNFNPIDNPDIGSPEGTNPLDVNTVPDVEALQTGYLTPSLLTANYTFEPAGEGNGGDDLNLEDRVPESDECRGTSQSAPYVPEKGFYLGTLKTQVIASGDIEAYPSTTATLSLVPQDPDATQYWDLGDPVNLQVSTVDGVKTVTVNITAGAVNNDEGIVHEGSIPIVTSDPFKPTNINIVPSESGKEGERIAGTQQPGMPGYRPSPTGSNPTTLGTTPGAPSKYSFNSPPLWDYQVSFPPNAPPGAFIKPSVGVDAIKSNPYPPSVIQFPSARDVNVPAQVWTDSRISALPLEPLACLNYQLQIFLELYSTYPNEDPEDTTVRIPEGHEDPLQIIIRIVLLGDVREDYSSEEMPLAVSLAGSATPDTDYTILGEGQTSISGTEVLADYQFSENVLGVYVPAGVLNAQLKEVTIQVPVAILLDEEEEGDETIEVTPLFPEQPEEGSTPLILWESYETTIAIILGQLADILYNFKVLQDGGKLEGFGQDIGSEQVDIITVDIPEVVVGGGATYTFPQDSELFVCYVYLQLSDPTLGSSITANVYNTSLPGSPTILDSILTVPAGQTRSNPVVLSQTQFSNGDVLQVAILSVGSEFPGAGMQLFLGRKYGEGEEIDWERVGLTNTGNGYAIVFRNTTNYLSYLFLTEDKTSNFVYGIYDYPQWIGNGSLYSNRSLGEDPGETTYSRTLQTSDDVTWFYESDWEQLTNTETLQAYFPLILYEKGLSIKMPRLSFNEPSRNYLMTTTGSYNKTGGGNQSYEIRIESITEEDGSNIKYRKEFDTESKTINTLRTEIRNADTSQAHSGNITTNVTHTHYSEDSNEYYTVEGVTGEFRKNQKPFGESYTSVKTSNIEIAGIPSAFSFYDNASVTFNVEETNSAYVWFGALEDIPPYPEGWRTKIDRVTTNLETESRRNSTLYIVGDSCSIFSSSETEESLDYDSTVSILIDGEGIITRTDNTTQTKSFGLESIDVYVEIRNTLFKCSDKVGETIDTQGRFWLSYLGGATSGTYFINYIAGGINDNNPFNSTEIAKTATATRSEWGGEFEMSYTTYSGIPLSLDEKEVEIFAVDTTGKTTFCEGTITNSVTNAASYEDLIGRNAWVQYGSIDIEIKEETKQEVCFFLGKPRINPLVYVVSKGDFTTLLWGFFSANDFNLYIVNDEQGNETVELAFSEQKPSNNNFGGAVLLEGQDVSVRGNNYGADQQSNDSEPSLSSPTQSVWYKWVAPSSTPVTIHTLGSPEWSDTAIGIYTGAELDNLTLVGRNDDAAYQWQGDNAFGDPTGIGYDWDSNDSRMYMSAVQFTPTEGTTYYIQVDGWSDTQWSFVLSITTEGLNVPTPIQEETRRADIYRFDTQTLKWKRMPNAVSAISPLTAESDFISYHATPQTELLTDSSICPPLSSISGTFEVNQGDVLEIEITN